MKKIDIPALREALAAAKMSLPLEADDVAVFDADGDLVADTVNKRTGEAENANLFVAAVNALPGLLDLIDAQQRVVNAAKPFGEAFLQRGPVGNTYRLSSYERELCAALKRMEAPDGR